MKNRSVKAAVISASFALSALLLTGCQDIIYAKIMNEVQLDDAEVNGTVNSIVRFGDSSTGYVYYQNGLISYKSASSASHVSWTNGMQNLSALSYSYYDNTWSGVYVKKLAANDTYMYALAVTYKQDTSEGENVPDQQILYCSTGPGTDWTQVQSWTYSSSTAVTLFCTNTPKVAHRVAYIRVGTNLYQLTGASFPDTVTAADSSACSAYYFGGSPYPTSYWATGTNETASADATYWYYATSDMLYYTGTTTGYSDLGCSNIISMAVTSDAILLGTNGGGIVKVTNTDGVPGSSLGSFSTNADSALSSPYRILAMLCMDPSASETASPAIYASSDFTGTTSSTTGSYSDIGLWSYYASRGNWNRE
jgi:hypothetical protein